MTIKLFCNAIIKFVLGIILVGLLLFCLREQCNIPTVGCLWEFCLFLCLSPVL